MSCLLNTNSCSLNFVEYKKTQIHVCYKKYIIVDTYYCIFNFDDIFSKYLMKHYLRFNKNIQFFMTNDVNNYFRKLKMLVISTDKKRLGI